MAVRASWEETFMEMAKVLARMRGDCTRRKVAAIIFDHSNGDFIQAGYNGAPAGQPGCLEGACPRGKHYEVPVVEWAQDAYKADPYTPAHVLASLIGSRCACGNSLPCPDAVAPFSSYDTGPGACIAIHAEANACLRAGMRARGMTMVVTEEPCDGCLKILRAARLGRVVTPTSEIFPLLSWGHDLHHLPWPGGNRAIPHSRSCRHWR